MSEPEEIKVLDAAPKKTTKKARAAKKKASIEWLGKYKKKAEVQRKKAFKERGFAEFLTPKVGETRITIDTSVEPREREGKYGMQVILRVRHRRKDYDLSISMTSPLWRQVMSMLSAGKTTMTIVTAGRGRQKRQSLKEMA